MEITSGTKQNFVSTLTFIVGVALTTLCFFFISCGASTQSQKWPIAEISSSHPTETTGTSESLEGSVSLPSSAKIKSERLRPLTGAFRNQQLQRFNALTSTRVSREYSLTFVSNCDLDVLKGFVAKGWSPIVFLDHGNTPRLWAMVGYDTSGRIQLVTWNLKNQSGADVARGIYIFRLEAEDTVAKNRTNAVGKILVAE